jgi:hypothetical protein
MPLWGCRNEIEFDSNCAPEFFNQENLRTLSSLVVWNETCLFLWCVAVFWILFSWNTKCFGICDHLFFTQSALCSCLDCITCTRRWEYWHHLKPFWAMCLFLSLRSQWTQPLILSSMFSSSRSLLFLDQISVYLKVSDVIGFACKFFNWDCLFWVIIGHVSLWQTF